MYLQVCVFMLYDDINIKKMVREQLERKVGFFKFKKLFVECKDLVYKILEVNVKRCVIIIIVLEYFWMLDKKVEVDKVLFKV